MNPALPSLPARPSRRLVLALAVSLALHGLLLVLHFSSAPAPSRAITQLDVVLVNASSTQAPWQAQLLAQANLEGGGDAERGHATSPLAVQAAALPAALAAAQQEQAELERQQALLLQQLASRWQQPEASPAPQAASADVPVAEAQDDTEQLAQLNQRYAAVAERIQDYNRQPRRHFFAPSTSAVPYAEYVERWRERIEAVGNQHYPEAARGRLYGSLQLTVEVAADGSLIDAHLERSSGHALLDAAARRIVSQAAPFPAFSPSLQREIDSIVITRTWHFRNGALHMENP